MDKNKIIAKIIVAVLFIGGVMGLLKAFIPGLEHFDYRYLLTGTSTFSSEKLPFYAVIYGVVMALLEISCGVLFFIYTKKVIIFVTTVLVINALGCAVAIAMGDLFAVASLIIRIVLLAFFIILLKRMDHNQ